MEMERGFQEINQYDDSMFPVGIYVVKKESIIPRGRGFRDFHWHEELPCSCKETDRGGNRRGDTGVSGGGKSCPFLDDFSSEYVRTDAAPCARGYTKKRENTDNVIFHTGKLYDADTSGGYRRISQCESG